MKNTLADLNNYLFEELERLTDDELDDVQIEKEIKRANSICTVAGQIISNGNLAVNAAKARYNSMNADYKSPSFLLDDKDA